MTKSKKPNIEIKEEGVFIKVYTSGRLVAVFTQEEAQVIYSYLADKYGEIVG